MYVPGTTIGIQETPKMGSIRIISSLLVVLMITDSYVRISAFPYIQHQQISRNDNALRTIKVPLNRKSSQSHQHYMVVDALRAGEVNGKVPSLLEQYSSFVDEKPLIAKSITAGFVTFMANVFSQLVTATLLQQQQQQYRTIISIVGVISWRRTAVFLCTGLFFIGPYLHFWYGYLDRIFAMPKQQPATRIAAKVIVDQTIGLGIFFPLYFITMELLESLFFGRGTFSFLFE
jgi:hypothetical protein